MCATRQGHGWHATGRPTGRRPWYVRPDSSSCIPSSRRTPHGNEKAAAPPPLDPRWSQNRPGATVGPDQTAKLTQAGRRTIAIPGPLVDLLSAHREVQAPEQLTAGSLWEDQGYVFAQSNGRPIRRPTTKPGRTYSKKQVSGRPGYTMPGASSASLINLATKPLSPSITNTRPSLTVLLH